MSNVNCWKYESWLCLCHECSKLSDKFVKNMILCLPFTSWTDEEPGLVQVFFSQISPIGQSIPLSHWTEMSPTSFGSWFCKLEPVYKCVATLEVSTKILIWLWNLCNSEAKLERYLLVFIVNYAPLEVVVMPKRQMKMRRTISIGWSAPIYKNVDEPENFIIFDIYCVRFFKKVILPTFFQSKAISSP